MTTETLPLWPAPMVRRDGPEPSRRAAEEHSRSGKADSHRAVVLAEVRKSPGQTAGELNWVLRLGVVEVRRRLYDLSSQEPPLIRRGPTRHCCIAENLQSTWWPIEQGGLSL